MKYTPTNRRDIFNGKMTPCPTTIPNLMMQPKGSTCLYHVENENAFRENVREAAIRHKAKACLEPLFAINISNDQVIHITRVTIEKQGKVALLFRSVETNFCAPLSLFGRCKKGTTCVYEIKNNNKIRSSFRHVGAKVKTTTIHLIDLRRGTNKPVLWLEVIRAGRPYKYLSQNHVTYAGFLDEN